MLIGVLLAYHPHFFAQVKTTRLGYDNKNRLRVQVSANEAQKLNSLPAPTYIIGIDDITEQGYIICAKNEQPIGMNGLPTIYPLNEQHQDILWSEVKTYWETFGVVRMNSHFVDADRK